MVVLPAASNPNIRIRISLFPKTLDKILPILNGLSVTPSSAQEVYEVPYFLPARKFTNKICLQKYFITPTVWAFEHIVFASYVLVI